MGMVRGEQLAADLGIHKGHVGVEVAAEGGDGVSGLGKLVAVHPQVLQVALEQIPVEVVQVAAHALLHHLHQELAADEVLAQAVVAVGVAAPLYQHIPHGAPPGLR